MPETTENYHHIPIKDKEAFVDGSFATIDISKEQGIKAVIGKLKSDPDGATHIQKYLFDVEKSSMAEAERWVSEHKKRMGVEKRAGDGNFRFAIDGKQPRLMGTAVPYNSLSVNPLPGLPGIKERILPGAFKRSLESGRDVFMLWNHELKFVFGRTSRGTLRLKEDQNGVQFENDVPDAGWAKDLLPSIKRGDISNMSFSFEDNVAPSMTREGKEIVRNVRDATLYEISVVTYPAYESTSVYTRSGELILVDGDVVLDYTSPEKIIETEKAKDERFDHMMRNFESFKTDFNKI